MNNSDFQTRFYKLSTFFTSDAWKLLESFLENLQEKIDQLKFTKEEHVSVLNGIIEFIEEFSEDYKGRAKIRYSETLTLIQEIGSLSDILQSMDIQIEQIIPEKTEKISPGTTPKFQNNYESICPSCNWKNFPDSIFCDKCGVRIEERLIKSQELIKLPSYFRFYPNLSSFLISFFSLLAYGIIIGILSLITNPEHQLDWLITTLIPTIITIFILPGSIFGLVLGFLIKQLYAKKDYFSIPKEVKKHSNTISIIFSYFLMFIILFVEGFVGYIILGMNQTWLRTELVPAVVILPIIPAITFGLTIGYFLERLPQKI